MSLLKYLCTTLLSLCQLIHAATFTIAPQNFVNVVTPSLFDISWTGAPEPVTILLTNGPVANHTTVFTIAGTNIISNPIHSRPD
jgi:hypothetical protein